MAKHIAFGEAVNQAESWAFQLLKEQLPKDYLLLTNIEIPTHTGQAMEVDALVVGEFSVYVVDVKGYRGALDVGLHAWTLDGRAVENSLSKANYVARVLSGNLKQKLPKGIHAPWCQGMVFVTGRDGEGIDLQKSSGALNIYTPEKIIAALTQEWSLTSKYNHAISEQQRQFVLDTIGQVALVEQRNQRIQDFEKKQCLYEGNGLEVWQADYHLSTWQSAWLLKILVATHFDDVAEYRQQGNLLKEQLQRMQALAGCSGVPLCAPIIDTGEQLVLPIRNPKGMPSQLLDLNTLEPVDLLRILRRASTSLQQIHNKGYCVGNWQDNQVFVSSDAEVEFLDIDNSVNPSEDLIGFAQCFSRYSQALAQPMIRLWFARAAQGLRVSLDELRGDLSALLSSHAMAATEEATTSSPSAKVAINHRYRLDECIRRGDNSDIWRAWHLQGSFPCAVSVYRNVEQNWLGLSDQYRRLQGLYHPNVERVIELGQNTDSDEIFFAREWVQGDTLRELRDRAEAGEGEFDSVLAGLWFDQLYQAMSYLHSFDIFHGGVSLRNIVCNGSKATLVNFALGLDAMGDQQVRAGIDDEIWALEGAAQKDSFALVASFIVALSTEPFPTQLDMVILRARQSTLPKAFATAERQAVFDEVLGWLS